MAAPVGAIATGYAPANLSLQPAAGHCDSPIIPGNLGLLRANDKGRILANPALKSGC
jgi:hypothetical protein